MDGRCSRGYSAEPQPRTLCEDHGSWDSLHCPGPANSSMADPKATNHRGLELEGWWAPSLLPREQSSRPLLLPCTPPFTFTITFDSSSLKGHRAN